MAEKWTYGEEGEAWPVQPGDVWRVGEHTFICSNLMVDHLLDEWLITTHPPAPADVMYADPPWNQSNINSFHTKAGLPPAEHQWSDVYQRIIDLAAVHDLPLWLEGGNRQADTVHAMLAAAHDEWSRHVAQFPITYYRTRPATIHYAGPVEPSCDPTGLDDGLDHETVNTNSSLIPAVVLGSTTAGTVIDPCSGRGLTSRCANLIGWASINNELHPARMSAAINRLHLITNQPPERIHHV